MTQLTRRGFLGASAAAAAATLVSRPAYAATTSPEAATIIRNARVWTGRGTIAEALAIGTDGKVMAVGPDRQVMALKNRRTVTLSAAGATVASGIHDGHIHPAFLIQYLIYPSLGDAQLTVAELQSSLNAILADPSTTYRGDWLYVLGWNPVACPVDAPANKSQLDGLVNPQNRPIVLKSSDGHSCWANSRALELAGITASTPDPAGGRILRDESGVPTGVLAESAQALVLSLMPPLSVAARLPYMDMLSAFMAKKGITSIQDPRVDESTLELYALAGERDLLRQRTQAGLLVPKELLGDPAASVEWAEGQARMYAGTPWLTIKTVKIFLDGVMEYPSQTAALIDPYLNGSGAATNYFGELLVDAPTLSNVVTAFDKAGWQVHMHAIGDLAVRTGLDAVAAARRANGSTLRHTIAHLQLVDPSDYSRFGQLGVIPSFQLQWACSNYWTNEALKPYIGNDRWLRQYPARSVLAAGGRLAGGSDWPVDPLAPWNQIATAVDRIGIWGMPEAGQAGTGTPLNAEEGITLAQAIDMHTKGGAYQLNQEEITGTVAVGMEADLQILDVDATRVSTARLATAQVRRTFRAGVTTWDDTAPSDKVTPAKMAKVEAAVKAAASSASGCGCTTRH